jgi:hypothetical protein
VNAVTIESAEVRVGVLPGFGARVVSLVDKRTGRDWFAPGPLSDNNGEDTVYGADEAVGWDECFPTVSPWDASASGWGRRLRDHGDLWGRAWAVENQGANELVTRLVGQGFTFTRRLSLVSATLTAAYTVENTGTVPLPFMWALHGLLMTRVGEEIRLPGVNDVVVTHLALDGRRLDFAQLPWPGVSTALPFPLDHVQSVETHFAGKFYAPNVDAASVGGEGGWLDFTWEGVDHLGIWLAYGGWPAAGNIHHVALEPTTAPADHLGDALKSGTGISLNPGDKRSWKVSLTLRPGNG